MRVWNPLTGAVWAFEALREDRRRSTASLWAIRLLATFLPPRASHVAHSFGHRNGGGSISGAHWRCYSFACYHSVLLGFVDMQKVELAVECDGGAGVGLLIRT